MDDILLEPLKAYESVYQHKIKEEAEAYFLKLKEKSGVDETANKETIRLLKLEEKKKQDINKKLARLRVGKGFTIFGLISGIVLFLIGLFFIISQIEIPLYVSIPMSVVGALLIVGMIVLLVKVINPRIKDINKTLAKIEQKIKELINIAWSQMAPLNALYDWNMPNEIITNMIPLLKLDKYLDGNKFHYLVKNYGFDELLDPNISTVCAQSGQILGNPFVVQTSVIHGIYDKVYTGSLLISWTEYYYDSDGHRRSRRRTQTLHASTTHPAPRYTNSVKLVYGNLAAPDLTFSRGPSGMSGTSGKKLDKFVEDQEKKLDKKAERDLLDSDPNTNFTALGNKKFEALFDATNRDHEMQFRLLFTPLAQTNMTNFILSDKHYGDDFFFYKHKKINIISSKHSQTTDYSGNPSPFINYDYEVSKATFISFTENYFKSLYFDFIPLLSIPLYQQTKTLEYIYGDDSPTCFSPYEHEIFANSFNDELFKHPKSITQAILKTRILSKGKENDLVEVTAYSYEGIDRVDFVPVMGGDGHIHQVPVPWIEYIPLENKSRMSLKNTNKTRNEFTNALNDENLKQYIHRNSKDSYYSFQRGLLALLVNEYYNQNSDSELESILNKND